MNRDAYKLAWQIGASRSKRGFNGSPTNGPPRIVATHHKAMTTYFSAVLRCVALSQGKTLVIGDEDPTSQPEYDYFLSHNSLFDPTKLEKERCVKIQRDPRDMIISAYFYHLWTSEEWANTRWNGNASLKEKLNSMDRESGIQLEIDRFAGRPARTLRAWRSAGDQVLFVKYEELMGDNTADLHEDIADHWMLEGPERKIFLNSLQVFSFEGRTGRKKGTEARGSHLRGGAPGGWRQHFTRAHEMAFNKDMGDILELYGYSQTDATQSGTTEP